MNSSKRATRLLNYSKFELKSICLSVSIEAVHTMITDDNAPGGIVEQVIDPGKAFIVVETGTGSCIAHHNRIKGKRDKYDRTNTGRSV